MKATAPGVNRDEKEALSRKVDKCVYILESKACQRIAK